MTYRIARNGQIFGPYSLAEVERYLSSGQIVPADLAQSDAMQEWLPVAELFPAPLTEAQPYPGGLPTLFPDPPNLPWWLALLLEIITCLFFFVVWDIVESAWLRRVDKSSKAVYFYVLVMVLFFITLPDSVHAVSYRFFNGPYVDPAPISSFIGVIGLFLRLIARFVFRSELLRHFNGREPIGLRLNPVMTLIFGGLYFQYHFNRINALKHQLRISVPTL